MGHFRGLGLSAVRQGPDLPDSQQDKVLDLVEHRGKKGARVWRKRNNMAKTWHYKLVLLGDTAVGKSCLVVRFVRDEFFEFQEPTIGAAFLTQTVALDDATVKFEIWDTAGQGE